MLAHGVGRDFISAGHEFYEVLRRYIQETIANTVSTLTKRVWRLALDRCRRGADTLPGGRSRDEALDDPVAMSDHPPCTLGAHPALCPSDQDFRFIALRGPARPPAPGEKRGAICGRKP